MTTLLSLDPGGSTGWSFWTYSPSAALEHVDHGTITGGLRGFLAWWGKTAGGDPDEIVAEDFILDGRTARPDTTPLEILGALEVLAQQAGAPLIRQRNTQKVHAPDDMLKRVDLWWPGKGHDRDSARHALALMKTRRHGPTIAKYWGRRKEGRE